MHKVRIGFVPSYRFGEINWCRKMRADSLSMLAEIPGVEAVAPRPPRGGEMIDARQGILADGFVRSLAEGIDLAQWYTEQGVDGLIICPLDFGDERSSGKIAEQVGKPVLLFATREPAAVDGPAMARASDSYCGNLSTAAALLRRKIPFRYAGLFFPGEAELVREVRDFVSAVAVVKALRGAQIGQVGLRPATFETVAYDEIAMARKFGMNVIHADIADIVRKAQSLDTDLPVLQERIQGIRGSVNEVTVADDYLLAAARFELALEDFFRVNRLSAMAVQCWPTVVQMMKIQMCGLYGRMTGRGMLTACETDVLGALAMLANYAAARQEIVPHFVDWTIQHRDDPNKLLAWHCGNAPAALANDPGRTALRSRNDMTGDVPYDCGDEQAGLHQFQLKAGPVTFCRLAEYDGAWKMLIAAGEIIPTDEVLAGTWSWVQVKDHAKLYRTLVEEGFIHHASMIHGDQVAALKLACQYLDIQAVVVD